MARLIDEWRATLILAEQSSKELMRILKEQDEKFINNLLDGKCGFTLNSADGRSVELVPKVAEQTEPSDSEKPNNSKVSGIPTGSERSSE